MLFSMNEIDFDKNDRMTEDSINRLFKAIVAGDTISEDVWHCIYVRNILDVIDTEEYPEDAGRWNYPVDVIFEIDNKYFRFTYYKGLTEYQDNEYNSMAAEPVHKVSRTVVVEEWESDDN